MTIAQARSYVLARLGISSGESATVDDLIDLMLDTEYQRLVLKYRLVVKRATVSTVAGNPVVALPSDLNEILKLNYGDITLEPIVPDDYADLVASTADVGGAMGYMQSGTLSIRIYPDANGEDLTLWYGATAATWNNSNTTPSAMPAAFHDLPCERVVAFIALLDEATELAALANQRAEILEAGFVNHIGRRGGLAEAVIRPRGIF